MFSRRILQDFDRPTRMWLIGNVVAMGLAVAGVIWAETGSVRGELRAELRTEVGSVRNEIRENRVANSEPVKGHSRIEAILEQRLPRGR